MSASLTPATSVDTLKKEAKRWLKALRASDPDARSRLERAWPAAPAAPVLRDVQHALAIEYGHENWAALKRAVDAQRGTSSTPPQLARTAAEFERLAADLVRAFDEHDQAALARLNQHYGRTFTFDDLWAEIWRRVYSFRQRAFKATDASHKLHLTEAQTLIAQDAGFGNWGALTHAVSTGAPAIPPYVVDEAEGSIAPRRRLTSAEWDALVAVASERRIPALDAIGLMTDDVIARVAQLDHIVNLDLGGSRELSDAGLLQLARMPQLEVLNLSEYPGGKLTDRGLEVLRHLPNLRMFEMTWQGGITDAGVSNLRFCDRLEKVILMGSPTGDGAIEALQGKPALRYFSSGREVTDLGLSLLQHFPMLKDSHGDRLVDLDRIADAGHLLIDGPITDKGLAGLAGLAGVYELDLFWHVTNVTAHGFRHLAALPNLLALGADGELSGNDTMRQIAALPRLRSLRAQSAVADDDGFAALSRSQTLESFWGRECPNFGSRGFVALSNMPALQRLGIGCKNVDDEALSTLRHFPSLRKLTPIGVTDDGFRHVGRCPSLDWLECMYCRETTDRATAAIADLKLRRYYAGLTKITDRSLEILGRMSTLERIDLYECRGITDAGLAFLATLPNLRKVHLDGLPGITLAGTRVLPAHVHVKYSA